MPLGPSRRAETGAGRCRSRLLGSLPTALPHSPQNFESLTAAPQLRQNLSEVNSPCLFRWRPLLVSRSTPTAACAIYSVARLRHQRHGCWVQSPGRKSRPAITDYRSAFGAQVRALRQRAGVSQEDLAHRIEMSRRYLSGIERGDANPTLDQIVRLADALSVEPRDLLPSRRE